MCFFENCCNTWLKLILKDAIYYFIYNLNWSACFGRKSSSFVCIWSLKWWLALPMENSIKGDKIHLLITKLNWSVRFERGAGCLKLFFPMHEDWIYFLPYKLGYLFFRSDKTRRKEERINRLYWCNLNFYCVSNFPGLGECQSPHLPTPNEQTTTKNYVWKVLTACDSKHQLSLFSILIKREVVVLLAIIRLLLFFFNWFNLKKVEPIPSPKQL